MFSAELRIQSFAYWLPIHCIGELGLVWGAVVCAASLTSAVWIMFRMDVRLGSRCPVIQGSLPVRGGTMRRGFLEKDQR